MESDIHDQLCPCFQKGDRFLAFDPAWAELTRLSNCLCILTRLIKNDSLLSVRTDNLDQADGVNCGIFSLPK